ncbi:T6SS effector BTH_I2691 family protein [Cupriavidus campinensis]
MAIEKTCGYCDKRGLLILPVRYAVAPIDMGLPAVTAPLKVEDTARSVGKGQKQDLTLHGSARYTTRLLRCGYLYVYDEKRDRMDAYWISEDGYYRSIPAATVVSESSRSLKPCSDAGHVELAGCIGIPDATQAGIVWFGYSDVQWTRSVMDAHRGAAGKPLRELHMRAFDAGAWAKAHQTSPGKPPGNGRGNTPHAVPIGALATTVADYVAIAKSAPIGPRAFMPPSAPNFSGRAGRTDATQSACRRRSPDMQAAIIALDDPAGVAQDLAALIHWHQERLLDTYVPAGKYDKKNGYGNYPTTHRNLAALDGAIKSFRQANDEKVKLQVFHKADVLADYLKVSYEVASQDRASRGGMAAPPDTPEDVKRKQEMDAAIRNPSPQTIQSAQNESWGEYLRRFKPELHSAWRNEFKTQSDALQAQHVEPLAKAHAAWMRSNLLANKLDCTHGGSNALSGDAYAETLQRCIATTQQIEGCAMVYLQWLKGDITDRSNLLLRGLVLRQDTLIREMAAMPLDPAKLPWATRMDQYQQHMQALLKPAWDAKVKAAMAQDEVDKAKGDYGRAYGELISIAALEDRNFADNPYYQKVKAAQERVNAAEEKARAAKQETNGKLLPDSVASLLVHVAAPIATALREYNNNAAERTLARWMAIIGVTMRTPVGVIDVSGKAGDTIKFLAQTFVGNLVEAGKRSDKPLSNDQIRQLTAYAERQVAGSFVSGNIGAFNTAAGSKNVKAKLAVFITDDMDKTLANIKDPTKKIAWLVEHVKTPKSLHEYGVLKIGRSIPIFGAASMGILTAIDAVWKFAGWEQMLQAEAQALSFQKTWTQDVRVSLGYGLYVGALAAGAAAVAQVFGTWRNLYATGMVERTTGERMAKRAGIALRVAGALTAVISGVVATMDIVDGAKSLSRNQWALGGLQIIFGVTGATAAAFVFWAALAPAGSATLFVGLSLAAWGLVLAVVMVALGMAIDHVKGDKFAQWLERSYWGRLQSGRYPDSLAEQTDFNQVMTEA